MSVQTLSDYEKAARYQHPEYLPVRISILPAAWKTYQGALSDIAEEFPLLFPGHDRRTFNYDKQPDKYNLGEHVDAWGCVWENVRDGMDSIVTGHPYPTRLSVQNIAMPTADDYLPHGFMFLRITDLRGFEEAMVDFAEEPPELQRLIDTVLAYNMGQVDKVLALRQDHFLYFGDDLGMQHALPISPAKWRKWLKPCYKALYRKVMDAGRSVYMHTDGCIHEIIPDLIECGVTILNPQIRANGLQNLVRTCKGKVCINLDLDRQLFPFATPEQIDEHVRQCVEALYLPKGGLMLLAECAPDVSLVQIRAICRALMTYRAYR